MYLFCKFHKKCITLLHRFQSPERDLCKWETLKLMLCCVAFTVTPGLAWRGTLIVTGQKGDLRELNDLKRNKFEILSIYYNRPVSSHWNTFTILCFVFNNLPCPAPQEVGLGKHHICSLKMKKLCFLCASE